MYPRNSFFQRIGLGMVAVLMNMTSLSAVPVHADKKENSQGMSQRSAQEMKKQEKKDHKALVTECMQEATEKKKTVFKAADEAWNMALQKSKATKDKAALKTARDIHKKALKTTQTEFQKDQRACKKVKTSKKKENELKITLVSQNNSSESGTAILKEEDGKVTVTLELAGAPTDVSQPTHVHMGSCATLGGVKFSLTNVLNGKSQTILDTTLAALTSELLAINVHKSAAEATMYVACGDVKF